MIDWKAKRAEELTSMSSEVYYGESHMVTMYCHVYVDPRTASGCLQQLMWILVTSQTQTFWTE